MKHEQTNEQSAHNQYRAERVREGAEQRFDREHRDLARTQTRYEAELGPALDARQLRESAVAARAHEDLQALFSRQAEELTAQQERERAVFDRQLTQLSASPDGGSALHAAHVEEIRSMERERAELQERQTAERKAFRSELLATTDDALRLDRSSETRAEASRRDELTLGDAKSEANLRREATDDTRRNASDAAARVEELRDQLTERFVASYVEREVMSRQQAERVAQSLSRALPAEPPGDLEAVVETVRQLMDAAVRQCVEQGLTNAKQHNQLGTTAHRYAEYLIDQLNVQLMATDRRVGVFAEQFLTAKSDRDWIGTKREPGMRGVDAVVYFEGDAVCALDLKTGRLWSKKELEAVQEHLEMTIWQHRVDPDRRNNR